MRAMSERQQQDEIESLEFKWGKKRGCDAKKKVQFYESFTYDGEEYFLYDSVYLFKEGEADPHIGKLIKIWEHANKSKKVKVVWFFRPSEISSHLGGLEPLRNELFLATGVGTKGSGLENINPLEAIAGKCNVVCISKDERNRKPSLEELTMADYIFYRTFDVDKFTISDKLGEHISLVAVKFLLNNNNTQISNPLRAELSSEGPSNDFVAGAENGLVLQKKDIGKADLNAEVVPIEQDQAARYSLDAGKHSPLSNSDGAAACVGKVDPSDKGGKMVGSKPAEFEGLKNSTSPRKSSKGDHLKLELDGGSKYCSDKIKETIERKSAAFGVNGFRYPLYPSSVPDQKSNSDLLENPLKPYEAIEKVNYGGDLGSLDGRPSKKFKSDDYSRNRLNLASNSDKSKLQELSNPADVSNAKQRHEHNKDSHGPLKNLVKSAGNTLDDRPLKKLKSAEPVGSSMQILASDSAGGKIKAPLSHILARDGKLKQVVKDSYGANASPSKKMIDSEKVKKLPNDKSHIAPSKQIVKKDAKVYGQVVEVKRRPDADSSKWFTNLPWEDRMKAAQEEGTLVLLRNLDPKYTSSEVEDIVWHSFRENCTAKVLQHAAISRPHSGQAFVIIKTPQAAERVVRKLEEGFLMLPNGRPLLGCMGFAHLPGKPSSFPGHLVIDRLKHQMQKDKREAVSTAHSSQPNTLEYDMAMEWRILQARSELMWKKLFKKQFEDLENLRGNLKRKL